MPTANTFGHFTAKKPHSLVTSAKWITEHKTAVNPPTVSVMVRQPAVRERERERWGGEGQR